MPGSELFRRHPSNPILTGSDWPYPAHSVFNPGATTLLSGETLLLVRVEDHTGTSHLTAARSADGITSWRVDAMPTLTPSPERYPEEAWGIEDARLVWLRELDTYAMTYTAYSRRGPLVSLALTRDFAEFERRGTVLPPENKDAALLPTRIGGRWAMIHRPTSSVPAQCADIWMSFSPDLRHWGDHVLLLERGRGGTWDADRIGIAAPPVPTEAGWLLLYHGVRHTGAGPIYRLGLALLDRDDPRVVLARSPGWAFGPAAMYELLGDVPNVVFPCGAVVDATGRLLLYYGAADRSVAVATASLADLVAAVQQSTLRPA